MDLACQQARKAFAIDEVPIGAILVNQQGVIIARGYNQVEKQQSQLAHAEMLVLAKASKKNKNWRMTGLTLYVTLQPCMMCLGALYLSRISKVVYGVVSPKYGIQTQEICGNGIYSNLDISMQCLEYEPAQILLQSFFQKKRSKHEAGQSRIKSD